MSEDYTQKYLKYKNKYIKLKAEYLNRNKQYGGNDDNLNQLTSTPTLNELNTLYIESNDINKLKLLGGSEDNEIRPESTDESTNVSTDESTESTESSDSPDSTESTNTSSTVDSSPINSELNETLTLSSLSSLKTDV
jgi:hypothetical protein